MTGRIKIIRKTTSVVDGRRQQEEKEFFSCWCDVKSLGTNEKYNALQIGLENTIMFETRACDKMEEIRLNLKEFYAVYKGVEFKIYDAYLQRVKPYVNVKKLKKIVSKHSKRKEREKHERMERSVRNGGRTAGGVRHNSVTDNGISETQYQESNERGCRRKENHRMAARGA